MSIPLNTHRKTILVLECEPFLTKTIVQILNDRPNEFVAIGSTSVAEAKDLLKRVRPDLVLSAAIMPDSDGIEHAIEMREQLGLKVLLMSAYPNAADALEEANSRGHEPFEILAKPIPVVELLTKIRAVLADQK